MLDQSASSDFCGWKTFSKLARQDRYVYRCHNGTARAHSHSPDAAYVGREDLKRSGIQCSGVLPSGSVMMHDPIRL